MNVDFFEPSPAQKVGGLEPAIRCLERYLKQAGVPVRCDPSVEDLDDTDGASIVHFHGLWQPKFLKVSAHCRRAKIPYVVSPHGMLEPWARRHKGWKKWPWYHLFERRHLLGAARLLATSESETRNLEQLLPSVICRGIPLGLTAERRPDYPAARRTLGWLESEIVLLFLSRVHPKKGLHLLLRALAGLEPEYVRNVRLVIVGGGEKRYLRELKRFIERSSLRLTRVEWAGEIWDDRKWTYLQGADLFCLPSLSENFGLAVLEALQVGTQVLTTDRTPWDMIPALGAGRIVEPTEDKVRSALHELLAGPAWTIDQRERLAEEIGARFSWDAIGPEYLRFYEAIAAESRRGRGS